GCRGLESHQVHRPAYEAGEPQLLDPCFKLLGVAIEPQSRLFVSSHSRIQLSDGNWRNVNRIWLFQPKSPFCFDGRPRCRYRTSSSSGPCGASPSRKAETRGYNEHKACV